MKIRSAREIAEWFVAWGDELDAEVSTLKLQKLLYYSQGEHIAATGRKLFSDKILAWQHGPVTPGVYSDTKSYGRNPIDPDEFVSDEFNWDDYSDVSDELVTVWRKYGIYSAWALREKTHSESPWLDAWAQGQNIEITDAALKDFFLVH